ncbi:MAG: glycosyltransferase [Gammaproteobacteria bacterium]|nr:glycosyltransferase [Gammaproteobacteria bacterium]
MPTSKISEEEIDFELFLHDFFPVCASYTLMNYRNEFCHVPDLSACKHCAQQLHLPHLSEKHYDIIRWRTIWSAILLQANKIVCFSQSSRQILRKAYPDLDGSIIKVVPHDVSYFKKVARPIKIKKQAEMVIGIVGNIGSAAKGLTVVESFVDYVMSQKIAYKIVFVGNYTGWQHKGVVYHGFYNKNQLPDLVKKYDINIVLFPSVWPETFSYLVSEIITLDLPLVCFDVGAQAEEVSRYHRGEICKGTQAEMILHSLQALHSKVAKDIMKKHIYDVLHKIIYGFMEEVCKLYKIRQEAVIDIASIKKIAVISIPRSGSKLFCEMMVEENLGKPREFFERAYEECYRDILEDYSLSFEDYYKHIILGSFNKETNVFSINFHGYQIRKKTEEGVAIDDLDIDYFFYMERRDEVAQAYSLAKAESNQLWSIQVEREAGVGDDEINGAIDILTIEENIRKINEEKHWIKENFSEKIVKTIYYEDIVSDKRAEVFQEIFDIIGMDRTPHPLRPLPLGKQATQGLSF